MYLLARGGQIIDATIVSVPKQRNTKGENEAIMLAGVMHYKKDAASPLHLHENCEHFYFIINGKATVESEDGIRPVGPGDMIFIPAEEKHRLRATEPLFYFEFQAPNRFKTTILDGTEADLHWNRKDGRLWVQT